MKKVRMMSLELTVRACITVITVELVLVLEEEPLAGPGHRGDLQPGRHRHLREHRPSRRHHHHLPVRRSEQHLQHPQLSRHYHLRKNMFTASQCSKWTLSRKTIHSFKVYWLQIPGKQHWGEGIRKGGNLLLRAEICQNKGQITVRLNAHFHTGCLQMDLNNLIRQKREFNTIPIPEHNRVHGSSCCPHGQMLFSLQYSRINNAGFKHSASWFGGKTQLLIRGLGEQTHSLIDCVLWTKDTSICMSAERSVTYQNTCRNPAGQFERFQEIWTFCLSTIQKVPVAATP